MNDKKLIPIKYQRGMLVWAFRYALGRATIAPVDDVVQTLKSCWFDLPECDRELYKREIAEAIKRDRAGMEMDITRWKEILSL